VFYPLTNRLDTPAQLARHECRRHILRWVAEAGAIAFADSGSPADGVPPSASFRKHHNIATNQSNPIDLFALLRENNDDPPVKVKVTLRCRRALPFSDAGFRTSYRSLRITSFSGCGSST
jgi:hypothetical protein